MAFLITRPDDLTEFIIDYKTLDRSLWNNVEGSQRQLADGTLVERNHASDASNVVIEGPLSGFTTYSDGHCGRGSLRILAKKILSDYFEKLTKEENPRIKAEIIDRKICSMDGKAVIEAILDSLTTALPSIGDHFYLSAQDYLRVLFAPKVITGEKLCIDAVDGKVELPKPMKGSGPVLQQFEQVKESEPLQKETECQGQLMGEYEIGKPDFSPMKIREKATRDWLEGCYTTMPSTIKRMSLLNPDLFKEIFSSSVMAAFHDIVLNDTDYLRTIDIGRSKDTVDGGTALEGAIKKVKLKGNNPLTDIKIQEFASMLFVLENSENDSDSVTRAIVQTGAEALSYCLEIYEKPTMAFLMVTGGVKLLRKYYNRIKCHRGDLTRAVDINAWKNIQEVIPLVEQRFGVTWKRMKAIFKAAEMIVRLYSKGAIPGGLMEMVKLDKIKPSTRDQNILKMYYPFIKVLVDHQSFANDSCKVRSYLETIAEQY